MTDEELRIAQLEEQVATLKKDIERIRKDMELLEQRLAPRYHEHSQPVISRRI